VFVFHVRIYLYGLGLPVDPEGFVPCIVGSCVLSSDIEGRHTIKLEENKEIFGRNDSRERTMGGGVTMKRMRGEREGGVFPRLMAGFASQKDAEDDDAQEAYSGGEDVFF